MSVAGVVLAAGDGTRFKRGNKLLLPFHGRPVIYHSVREALRSKLEPVILVIGYEGERILTALGDLIHDPKIKVLRNEQWLSGRASSVNTAIEGLSADARGAVFLQGDMPLMTYQLIDFVVGEFTKSEVGVCFPLHEGEKGHPVAFSRELLAELCRLRGDRSGLALVKKHWDEALKLPLEDESTQYDLDTYEDYLRLLGEEPAVKIK
jgi:molybdenum cofactor cytidylyltransferase